MRVSPNTNTPEASQNLTSLLLNCAVKSGATNLINLLAKLSSTPNIPTVDKKIGDGSFAVAYSGRWGDKNVALKFLTKDTPQSREDFFNEATILNKVSGSEYIIKLFGFGTLWDHPFLILELAQCDLFAWIQDYFTPTLSPRYKKQANQFQSDLLAGLSYLHGLDPPIIHRDIKAENLLVTPEDGMRLKLADFGFAREYNKGKPNLEPRGTLGYIAPEIHLEHKWATPASDLYSAGVVFHILWTNCFTTEITKAQPAQLDRRRFLAPECIPLIASLLSYDPALRPTAPQARQQLHTLWQCNQQPSTSQPSKKRRVAELKTN